MLAPTQDKMSISSEEAKLVLFRGQRHQQHWDEWWDAFWRGISWHFRTNSPGITGISEESKKKDKSCPGLVSETEPQRHKNST